MLQTYLEAIRRVTKPLYTIGLVLLLCTFMQGIAQTETHIRKKFEIKDGIAPKSVVANGHGLFSAQNMMYRHTITLYNANGERLAKINDAVRLNEFGLTQYGSGKYAGAPVEGAFTSDGNYLWVSNYLLTGSELTNPGCDDCIGKDYDPGFLYKINTKTFEIEHVVEVGSVPKFLAISDDDQTLIVSNWVSSDISIIDLNTEEEVKRITVGAHPRGVAITADRKNAYVTIMGSTKIAVVDLETYAVDYLTKLGKSPRSVLLADNDSTLYISFNSSNEILKYNRFTAEKKYCKTLAGPRSMTLSPNGKALYIVNYFDDAFTKINTDSMTVAAEIQTSSKPIGICGNWEKAEIWVACYSGKIEVFKDFNLERSMRPFGFMGIDLAAFSFPPISANDSVITDTDTAVETEELEVLPLPVEIDTTTVITLVSRTIEDRKLPIKTPPLKEDKKTNLPEIENEVGCQFHIIIGAFSVKENAEKRKKDLIGQGFSAVVIKGSKYHYVSAQCFASRQAAEDEKAVIGNRVKNAGTPWILEQ